TGKSRGFGFVEMPDEIEAQTAIRALDGFHVNGRPIAVKQAEDRSANKGQANPSKPSYSGNNNTSIRKEEYSRPKTEYTPPPVTPDVFPPDAFKTDQRKKGKEKTKAELDAEIKAKKLKVDAQSKKANKYNKFYDEEDEDLDPDLFSYRKKDEEDFFDDEDDDDI
ncbi:MAG: RNA recognition motif domain-containing protein, partial [Crocinitomicaceae bacterium]